MIFNVNPQTFKQITLGRTVTEDDVFDSMMFRFQQFGQSEAIKMKYVLVDATPRLYIESFEQCREWYCMQKLGFKTIKVDIPY